MLNFFERVFAVQIRTYNDVDGINVVTEGKKSEQKFFHQMNSQQSYETNFFKSFLKTLFDFLAYFHSRLQ